MRSILGVLGIFRPSICALPFRQFHPHYYIADSIHCSRSLWSHEWELKQITFGGGTRVLRLLAVFREYMLRALEISTGSTLLILLSTPTISDVCTAGTACCTFCTTHHTPGTRSIWAFSTRTAHTRSTRSI